MRECGHFGDAQLTMARNTIKCVHCESPFTPKGKGRPPRFCSDGCCARYHHMANREKVRDCRHCKTPFVLIPNARATLFCSKTCHDANHARIAESNKPNRTLYALECYVCKRMFESNRAARCCSAKCNRLYFETLSRPDFNCRVCGESLPYGKGRSVTCSNVCRVEYYRAHEREYRRANRDRVNENRRALYARNPEARALKLARTRRWEERNKEQVAETRRAYRALNAEKVSQTHRLWKAQNPDYVRAAKQTQRERLITACAIANRFLPGEFTNYLKHGPAAMRFVKRFNINIEELTP